MSYRPVRIHAVACDDGLSITTNLNDNEVSILTHVFERMNRECDGFCKPLHAMYEMDGTPLVDMPDNGKWWLPE